MVYSPSLYFCVGVGSGVCVSVFMSCLSSKVEGKVKIYSVTRWFDAVFGFGSVLFGLVL